MASKKEDEYLRNAVLLITGFVGQNNVTADMRLTLDVTISHIVAKGYTYIESGMQLEDDFVHSVSFAKRSEPYHIIVSHKKKSSSSLKARLDAVVNFITEYNKEKDDSND